MTHSVEKHLVVEPAIYDLEIRRFVPGYEAMLDEALGALADYLPNGAKKVIDLGAGTGALSARVAARFPSLELILLDADPGMLAEARGRLSSALNRIELREGSFADPLPSCDAAVASLSLHHVHARDAKIGVYRNILRALPSGGVLINADAAVPRDTILSARLMKRWADHLVSNGDTEEQAFARFAQWAKEDRYFGLDEELDMLREAGFRELDVRFRFGPIAVFVAQKS